MTSRKYEGTGLGLSLVKSMAELHGGEVEMSSELGVGTILTVRFPRERTLGDAAEANSLEFPPQDAVPYGRPGGGEMHGSEDESLHARLVREPAEG
jgi:hypothetical protein